MFITGRYFGDRQLTVRQLEQLSDSGVRQIVLRIEPFVLRRDGGRELPEDLPEFTSPGSVRCQRNRTGRVVLAELFTGAGCGPCMAADAAVQRFDRKDVAVVVFHAHVPKPDPLTIGAGVARGKAYGVKATPTFALDGDLVIGTGGPRSMAENAWKRINTVIEKELATPQEATLTLQALKRDNVIQVTASVDPPPANKTEAKVVLVLVGDDVRYSGENGNRFHGMVARALSEGPRTTFDLDATRTANLKEMEAFEQHSDRFGKTKFRDRPGGDEHIPPGSCGIR